MSVSISIRSGLSCLFSLAEPPSAVGMYSAMVLSTCSRLRLAWGSGERGSSPLTLLEALYLLAIGDCPKCRVIYYWLANYVVLSAGKR